MISENAIALWPSENVLRTISQKRRTTNWFVTINYLCVSFLVQFTKQRSIVLIVIAKYKNLMGLRYLIGTCDISCTWYDDSKCDMRCDEDWPNISQRWSQFYLFRTHVIGADMWKWKIPGRRGKGLSLLKETDGIEVMPLWSSFCVISNSFNSWLRLYWIVIVTVSILPSTGNSNKQN